MAVMQDYIRWRGDITFHERPCNEVDNLVFSDLVYYHFEEVLHTPNESVTIGELYRRHQAAPEHAPYWLNDPTSLLADCAGSERFRDIAVEDFINIIDPERQIQFSAATFILPDNCVYAAFRGTDDSITGWREDFNFSYMEETPAQAEAVKYLTQVLEKHRGTVLVGGHSKGGNLAVYASAFCKSEFRDNIQIIYSNDGPGFNRYVCAQEEYLRILPKVKLIIPEDSIVGILLSNNAERTIIKSTAWIGLIQHHPLTWMVERDHFVLADKQSPATILLDEVLDRWIDLLNDEQKKLFTDAIFDVLEASGAVTVTEINRSKWISYNAILRAAATLKGDMKKNLFASVLKLAEASRDVIWNETQKRFEPLIQKRQQ